MRELTTPEKLKRFMSEVGRVTREPANLYFTGGATAILRGWRATTIDLDITVLPEPDEILRAIPRLKEDLRINVELAAPHDFIPELPGWRERSPFITREGRVSFFHYDPYAQALSKIERGHAQDVDDVRHMFADDLIRPERLLELFTAIEPELYRFPAIDPPAFRAAVHAVTTDAS